MRKNKIKRNFPLIILILFFLFICRALVRLYVVGLSPVVDGINMKEFSSSRDTAKEIITAKRGTIYDKNGEILAQDVNSYTVIAYLESSRTTDVNYPKHVVDIETTAEKLAPILKMKVSTLKNLLSSKGAYQVELGPGGRGISELVKEEIENLDLPGLDFVATTKRYYPYGNFLSYTLGYAKTNENNKTIGEFGLELFYNDILSGTDGYKEYQKDLYGYRIVNSKPIIKNAVDGQDIYLTVDVNIQMFLEQAIKKLEKVGVSFVSFTVANAKTGEILGVASNPNFDPNIKNIVSYYDPLVSYAYEPGSTMKIYTWMAAMENGFYDGKEKFKSGSLTVSDSKVTDWIVNGWGKITFDQGFMISSNVGATKLGQELGRTKLMDFYYNLGFGKPTNMTLPNEFDGQLTFKYETEIANASFGQGILTTPIQNIQALTSVTNEGTLLKPYLVSKIKSPDGSVTYEGKRTELRKVASTETINKIKKLMYDTVNSSSFYAIGTNYKIKNYGISGKTGTAQYASQYGGYVNGIYNNIKSFAGFFPYEEPEIVFYVSVKDLKSSGNELSSSTKEVIKNISTYLNIYSDMNEKKDTTVKLSSYINTLVTDATSELEANGLNVIKIGDGTKVINQYPIKGTILNKKEKVFLLTNSTNYIMPNMISWSRSDVVNYSSLIGITPLVDGYGYVLKQSIKEGKPLTAKSKLEITLKTKFITEKED